MSHRIATAALCAAAGLFASGAYAGSPFSDDGTVAKPVVQDHASKAFKRHKAAAAQPSATPSSAAGMPKMDADGFESRQSDPSFFEHAVGTDGTSVASDGAVEAPPASEPAYTTVRPKMDSDGRLPRESGSSFFNHAVGTDGSP